MLVIVLLILIYSITLPEAQSAETQNFHRAKTLAHTKVFTGNLREDIYCGCKYNATKEILWNTCGYVPRHNPMRGARLEWEHVIPAHLYVKALSCGSRDKCQQFSAKFRAFEGDLHNLRPAVGELNADRSDTLYGIVPKRTKQYGACSFYVGKQTVQPPSRVWGDIARITLYMSEKYNIVLPYDYILLMRKWNADDPVDSKEIEINRRIKSIQGDENKYVRVGQNPRTN